MSDSTKIIVTLINDMRDEQKEHARNSATHREETIKWQAQNDSRTERIEVDLKEHKEGVIQNRSRIKICETDINKINQPLSAKQFFTKLVLIFGGIGTIASATYWAIKYLGMLK